MDQVKDENYTPDREFPIFTSVPFTIIVLPVVFQTKHDNSVYRRCYLR